jgi:hypothetical protein
MAVAEAVAGRAAQIGGPMAARLDEPNDQDRILEYQTWMDDLGLRT